MLLPTIMAGSHLVFLQHSYLFVACHNVVHSCQKSEWSHHLLDDLHQLWLWSSVFGHNNFYTHKFRAHENFHQIFFIRRKIVKNNSVELCSDIILIDYFRERRLYCTLELLLTYRLESIILHCILLTPIYWWKSNGGWAGHHLVLVLFPRNSFIVFDVMLCSLQARGFLLDHSYVGKGTS